MPFTLEQKRIVTEQVNTWIDEKNPARSGAKLAEKAGINTSYLSFIKAGKYQTEASGRIVSIKDSYFQRIADAIGLRLDDTLHWDFIENFKRIQRACRKAQRKAIRMVVDGWTRMGKTHALENYAAANDYVLYVKCTQNMSAKDLLEEILAALGVHDLQHIRGNHAKLRTIKGLITNRKGYLIIIDEVEVVKAGIYGILKDISDWAHRRAGFIICGMDIVRKIDKLAGNHKPGFPQLRGRFFGNQVLTASKLSQGEIVEVCQFEGITNTGAQNVLAQYVTDLDMLAQYVRDVKDEQEKRAKKLTGQEVIELLDISVTTFKKSA